MTDAEGKSDVTVIGTVQSVSQRQFANGRVFDKVILATDAGIIHCLWHQGTMPSHVMVGSRYQFTGQSVERVGERFLKQPVAAAMPWVASAKPKASGAGKKTGLGLLAAFVMVGVAMAGSGSSQLPKASPTPKAVSAVQPQSSPEVKGAATQAPTPTVAATVQTPVPTPPPTPVPARAATPKPYVAPKPASTPRVAPAAAPASGGGNYYTNSAGNQVEPPSGNAVGATAVCKDGTYSHSQSRRGTCSGHGGVATWL